MAILKPPIKRVAFFCFYRNLLVILVLINMSDFVSFLVEKV